MDNGDTFQKITTTNASYVNTPVDVIAGQTYRYTATLRGTGNVNLFWQQRTGAFTQYATKTVTLTSTAQTVSFDTVIPSNGVPTQIGIGDIATTETVYVKDVKIDLANSGSFVRPASLPRNDREVFFNPLTQASDGQIRTLSTQVFASNLDAGLTGWSQIDPNDAAVIVDRPSWGVGEKAIQLTTTAGAPDNILALGHMRGHHKGIYRNNITTVDGQSYYFDFNMEIPSIMPGTQQVLRLYPRQTPSQTLRNFAGIEFLGGNGFGFATEIHSDGLYLKIQKQVGPPVGTLNGLNLYSDSDFIDIKLSNGILFDKKLHFRILYIPNTIDGLIVASIDGQLAGSANSARLPSGGGIVLHESTSLGTAILPGQSSTIFVDDIKISNANAVSANYDGVGTLFAPNYFLTALNTKLVNNDLTGWVDIQYDRGNPVTETQPVIDQWQSEKVLRFRAKFGDQWRKSDGSFAGTNSDYPRTEVTAEETYSRSVKYDRSYEMTGWMSFLDDPQQSFTPSINADSINDSIQAGFQFHAQATRGSSSVSMNLLRSTGWVFVSAPTIYNPAFYSTNPVADYGISVNDWVSDRASSNYSTFLSGQEVPTMDSDQPTRTRPVRRDQVILTWSELNTLVGGVPRYKTKMRYKLEWRPTLNNNGTGYIRYSIDMNDDGVFTANELRVNLKGPNGYWVTTLQDANGNDIKDAAGNPKWRYIIPTDPKDRAGELKMGLYDFDSKINSTGMTLYTSAPVLRRIN